MVSEKELARIVILSPESWKQHRIWELEKYQIDGPADADFLRDLVDMDGFSADLKLLALRKYNEYQEAQRVLKEEAAAEELRQKESAEHAAEYLRQQQRNAEIAAQVGELRKNYPNLEGFTAFLNSVPELTVAQERLFLEYTVEIERLAKEAEERQRIVAKEQAREKAEAESRRKEFEHNALMEAEFARKHLEEAWKRDAEEKMLADGMLMGMSKPLAALGRMVCSRCGNEMSRDAVTGRTFHKANYSTHCPAPAAA